MSYYIFDVDGYVGDMATIRGLRELREVLSGKGKEIDVFLDEGCSEKLLVLRKELLSIDKPSNKDVASTLKNLLSLIKKCTYIAIISDGWEYSKNSKGGTTEMRKFILFSKPFTVSDPIALIEAFCFQSDFYQNYDVLKDGDRTVENTNKIGARIRRELFKECKKRIAITKNLCIFKYNLDDFLKLDIKTSTECIDELVEKTVIPLLAVKGIGLAKVTKMLHTLYPEIIPMIDNLLQEEWKKTKSIPENKKLEKYQIKQLFVDYYQNLKQKLNRQHLNEIYEVIKKENLRLTKVRVFDILWWSYLKSKKIGGQHIIKWSTIN